MNTSQPPADEMPDAPGEKRSGTIQSVSIAARFLKTLANAEGELALGEVARRTGTGGSTAHRYLQSLVKEGLARQDPLSGLYDLGPAALSIGIGALKPGLRVLPALLDRAQRLLRRVEVLRDVDRLGLDQQ